ncbi:hypothetical protein PspCFBP13509_31040 [Pseudomonas sp. CFBP13509]|nr:hypothetical protein PspCFBP13509_31040 [Pseudomonas sp. CFBP13509]
MDGAWRRPPTSLSDYGHTEPGRGAEWWGKSPLLTLGLFQSEPPSGRNPKPPLPRQWICTRSNPKKWSAQRPSSGASPLPQAYAASRTLCSDAATRLPNASTGPCRLPRKCG